MQESLSSDSEAKAPLATFDTIDLGEEDQVRAKLNNDCIPSAHLTSSGQIQRLGPNDNIDGFPFGFGKTFGKSMNTNYRKLSNGNENASHGYESQSSANVSTDDSTSQGCHASSDSNSDSGSSDSEYIRSGYISVPHGNVNISQEEVIFQFDSPQVQRSRFHQNESSDDSTPFSSPILPRASISSLISELQNEKILSKRKALEKRIQRLQVTNTPVERPRSTTPINIHTFDEYKDFNSPEKSPCPEYAEKLRIKLPGEEFSPKLKSPWRERSARKDPHVFDFKEDHLFSRTKSALLVQNDGDSGLSPKRILLPPALSPCHTASSPRRSAFYSSHTSQLENKLKVNSTNSTQVSSQTLKEDSAWDTFIQASASKNETNPWCNQSETSISSSLMQSNSTGKPQTSNTTHEQDLTSDASSNLHDKSTISNTEFAKSVFDELFEKDEFLTVQIDEFDGDRFCDIRCGDTGSKLQTSCDDNGSGKTEAAEEGKTTKTVRHHTA